MWALECRTARTVWEYCNGHFLPNVESDSDLELFHRSFRRHVAGHWRDPGWFRDRSFPEKQTTDRHNEGTTIITLNSSS